RLRLEAYQKLSSAATATATDDAIDLVVDELTDRYGTPPEEVVTLVSVARLRRRAARAGLSDVVAMGSNLRVAPARFEDSMKVRLQRLYPRAKLVGGGEALVVPMPGPDGPNLLEWVGQLLTALFPEPAKAQA
ncbi:TRCF domain-containing protein, partial [Microbacterium sp.]|uniref:TRCF domain-containing protein n=1 Tax=Microbacterium sp. TaxID=51671 RepID=UPI0028128758